MESNEIIISSEKDHSDYYDYLKINYLILRKEDPQKWIMFCGFLVLSLLCILSLIALKITGDEKVPSLILITAAVLTFIGAFVRHVEIKRNAKSQLETNDATTVNYEIFKDGFRPSDVHENNYVRWNDYRKGIITKRYIILLKNNSYSFFNVKNYSDKDFEMIEEWVRAKVKII